MKLTKLFSRYSLRQLEALSGLSKTTLQRIKQGGVVSKRSGEKLKKVK